MGSDVCSYTSMYYIFMMLIGVEIATHQPNAGICIAQGQGLVREYCFVPCVSCNLLLHPDPTSAQNGLDPLQLGLVVEQPR